MTFRIHSLNQNSVAFLVRLRGTIKVDPVYQRAGEVWSREKQRLLIDSIINQFDIPKMYFHEHTPPTDMDGRRIRFSLVDGRQRLEAIWDFMDGDLALADDCVYLEDPATKIAGLTYPELVTEAPDVAAILAATQLDVRLIETDDTELIEEMFSRLNEAVPLSAAEKRNGRGGSLRAIVKDMVTKPFFANSLPFNNRRYRQFDLATKFIYWVDQGGPADTKKRQLDEFWDEFRPDNAKNRTRAKELSAKAEKVATKLAKVFEADDKLLASVGMTSIYFLLFLDRFDTGQRLPTRADLSRFELSRQLRRFEQEEDLTEQQQRLLEFDRLAQSPNDAAALKYRLNVLEDFLSTPEAFLPAGENSVSVDD